MIRFISILLIFLLQQQVNGKHATTLVVAPDSTGDYKSIQGAINATKAFPDQDITIHIKNGFYREKVIVYAWNTRLTLEGESKDSTIISWDDHFKNIGLGRNSTFYTYTMKVEANDITLKNLTIENTSGLVGQAVALHVDADRVIVENCTLSGHQDTLYAAGENARQYYYNCLISGTTDFIFGAATAVFMDCIIVSKSNSYITAASTPQSSKYGFVFISCTLMVSNPSVNSVYLGRPWRAYAKTVFIQCNMEDHILPAGWHNWNSREKEKTTFYAEYGSLGPGGNSKKRVEWSHILSKKEASSYTLKKILRSWKP